MGAGGMGVVYRAGRARTWAARSRSSSSRPQFARDPRFRELFIRESTTAAQLEHPNVIPVYRAGEDAGRLYIAMRFVEGAASQQLIAAAGPSPRPWQSAGRPGGLGARRRRTRAASSTAT